MKARQVVGLSPILSLVHLEGTVPHQLRDDVDAQRREAAAADTSLKERVVHLLHVRRVYTVKHEIRQKSLHCPPMHPQGDIMSSSVIFGISLLSS